MRIALAAILMLLVAGCGPDNTADTKASKTPMKVIHNGLGFEMTKQDVENLGFICTPKSTVDWFSFDCKHMEKSGELFGRKTSNYSVLINRDSQRVAQIGMNISGINRMEDLFDLMSKVEEFFPEKILRTGNGPAFSSISANSKGEKLMLNYFGGVRGVMKSETSVAFWSSERPFGDGGKK